MKLLRIAIIDCVKSDPGPQLMEARLRANAWLLTAGVVVRVTATKRQRFRREYNFSFSRVYE